MKNTLLSLSVIFILAACQHKADDSTGQSVPVTPVYNNSALSDTARSEAFYQSRKYVSRPKAASAQHNLPVAVHRSIPSETTSLPPVETSPVVTTPASTSTSVDTMRSSTGVGNDGNTGTASTIPQPEKKKGWSKAAKGAVIGAGAGAIGGAILSKKKGKGAIIGGIIGAAGGYVIGRGMDKKDSRFITN